MSHMLLVHTTNHAQEAETGMAHDQPAHAALLDNIDTLLETARPRLVRLARLQGVAPDAADDIAQETLLAAWRSLHHLRAPERFDAWLDGICRNMCRRWAGAQGAVTEQIRPIAVAWHDDEHGEEAPSLDLPDPQALDPAEELDRQDLEVLLERAMSHLPASAREALELCYLAELPQREAALRLGVTIGALELRLHRARKQLRDLLSGALRPDAEAFGLLPDDEPSTGWRASREWCNHCGRQRLRGIFEPMPDGRINFRMRCPACSPGYVDMHDTSGVVDLSGLHSFRPALKRMEQVHRPHFLGAWEGRRTLCMFCQKPVQVQLLPAQELEPGHLPDRFYIRLLCPEGHASHAAVAYILALQQPQIRDFWIRHPRWVGEPNRLMEYAGQPALCLPMTDIASASRLTVFAHYPTLRILAMLEE